MTPLVSVILPAFNAAPYLELALASILSQSHSCLEVIAIDDGSTDATPAILTRVAAQDERVRAVSRANRGLVATLNEGLSLARGDYIARMDADDIAYRDRLADQLRAFQVEPALALVATNVDYLHHGIVLRKALRSATPAECRVESMFHCMFVHPTVMLRTVAVQDASWRYDPDFPFCEDFALWSRITRDGQARLLPTFGLAWRQGHASVRSTRFGTAVFDSMRLVAGNLRAAGIAFDDKNLAPFFQRAVPVEAVDVQHLADALASVAAARGRFHGLAPIFDRGLTALLGNIGEAAARLGQVLPFLAALKACDLHSHLAAGARTRLTVQARLPDTLAAGALRLTEASHRRRVGMPISDVPELAREIRSTLLPVAGS